MKKISYLYLIIILIISPVSLAQERKLLYATPLTETLHHIITHIQDISYPKVAYANLSKKSDYFVRIAPRKYILTEENTIKASSILGTKPLVFFTTPEGIYGKSLLEIYLDIGYNTEDIVLWQRNQEMVAIIFRFPQAISFSDIKDGQLPINNWKQQIYTPTWDNIFTIFHRLTEASLVDENKVSSFMPKHLFFISETQKQFVLNFPTKQKQVLKDMPYFHLQMFEGNHWLYRQLLEQKLSIFKHFSGKGRTINAVKNEEHKMVGILEFIGPNMKIKSLPEFAIIDLGKLIIEDTYSLPLP